MGTSSHNPRTPERSHINRERSPEHVEQHDLDQVANSLESEAGNDYVKALKNLIDRAIAKLG